MSKIIDLTGKVFGNLTALERVGKDQKYRNALWKCSCACGSVVVVRSVCLNNGHTKSCGCERNGISLLTNKRFGRLVAKSYLQKNNRIYWNCVCDCGEKKVVAATALVSGYTKSCGCLRKEVLADIKKGIKNNNWKGGVSTENEKARQSYAYENWRKAVLARDNYTCKKCGEKAKRTNKLHVHHIRSFASNPKLRTEIKNGVCLCQHCHLSFHQRYGRDNNTTRQFTAFLKLKT